MHVCRDNVNRTSELWAEGASCHLDDRRPKGVHLLACLASVHVCMYVRICMYVCMSLYEPMYDVCMYACMYFKYV